LNWENVGWKVGVHYATLLNQVRPKDHIEILRVVLPDRYSPLQADGRGNQFYLTETQQNFAEALAGLIGAEAQPFMAVVDVPAGAADDRVVTGDDLDVWEHRLEERVAADTSIRETDREAIIRARRGQGIFKRREMQIERRCRITLVDNPVHLVASHCKPWRDSTNEERLNGENGLLLTPIIDHLLDRGFVGFEDFGRLVISPVTHLPSLQRMGIATRGVINVGGLTERQNRGTLRRRRQTANKTTPTLPPPVRASYTCSRRSICGPCAKSRT
jgi:hypothetical protein